MEFAPHYVNALDHCIMLTGLLRHMDGIITSYRLDHYVMAIKSCHGYRIITSWIWVMIPWITTLLEPEHYVMGLWSLRRRNKIIKSWPQCKNEIIRHNHILIRQDHCVVLSPIWHAHALHSKFVSCIVWRKKASLHTYFNINCCTKHIFPIVQLNLC